MSETFDSLPCRYKVGFLFKRVCGRVSREGCKFCKGVAMDPDRRANDPTYDPYFHDRALYYDDPRYYNSSFTDYDARGLATERDTDYETDMDAS